jgi:transcriptional antiterminator RfaH
MVSIVAIATLFIINMGIVTAILSILMNKSTIYWHVIYTRPKQERKIANELFKKQITYFLPVINTVRQWHDRKKVIQTPLFPSYIFVCLKDKLEFFNSESITGVCSFVKFGKLHAKVDQSTIDQISLVVNSDMQTDISCDYYKPGEKLFIKDGPRNGLSCELINKNGKDKYLVRVDLLNRNLLIDVESSNLTTNVTF